VKGRARAKKDAPASPPDAALARIARRVRRWREEAGFTLQQLAARSGVATSTVQKVEALQMVPSVAVLLKLARGLGRSASDLVADAPARAAVVHLAPGDRHPVGSPRRLLAERLSGDLIDARIEMWRITLHPGCGSGAEPFAYSGEELALGEAGEITFRIGDEEHLLRPGDVLHFKASAPHLWRNEGRAVARFALLGTVPAALREALGRRLSGRRHRTAIGAGGG